VKNRFQALKQLYVESATFGTLDSRVLSEGIMNLKIEIKR